MGTAVVGQVALDVDAAALGGLQEELVGGPGRLLTVQADVGDLASVAAAAATVTARLGGGETIDVIACFAGVIRGGPLMEMPDADLELVMRVNVIGTHRWETRRPPPSLPPRSCRARMWCTYLGIQKGSARRGEGERGSTGRGRDAAGGA